MKPGLGGCRGPIDPRCWLGMLGVLFAQISQSCKSKTYKPVSHINAKRNKYLAQCNSAYLAVFGFCLQYNKPYIHVLHTE